MRLDEAKQILICEAKRLGLAEYEIFYMKESGCSAETLGDEISSFSSSEAGGLCFRCVCEGRIGSASSELLEEEALRELVGRARDNALCIEKDDPAIFYDGSAHYADVPPSTARALSSAEICDTALALQRATYAESDEAGEGTQSFVFSGGFETSLYNSHGLSLSHRVTYNGAGVQAVVRRGEEAEDAYEMGCVTEDTLSELPARAVRAAQSKLGAVEIPSGSYDVIFCPKRMREMLSVFCSVFSAKAARYGLSLLAGKEGQAIAAPCITLIDDPMREGALCTPFDGEGVATYRKSVIEQGVLKTLLYDLVHASLAGVAPTGNGQRGSYRQSVAIAPYSFYLEGGSDTLDELIGRVKDGIYITEMKGFHAGADSVTGDFSIESAGFRIRDGKLCEPIRSFTVAGNFFDLLKGVEALSDTVSFGTPTSFTTYGAPAALVRGMSVAGK